MTHSEVCNIRRNKALCNPNALCNTERFYMSSATQKGFGVAKGFVSFKIAEGFVSLALWL
jgi:hypothetical protein